MLSFHSAMAKGEIEVALDSKTIPAEVNWIDAFRPEKREIAFLERVLGIDVPTLEDLSEIESSSRLYTDKNYVFLSTPSFYHTISGMPRTTPLGFVLSKDVLLTVRFKPLKAFNHLQDALVKQCLLSPGGPGALIAIFEMIVEHIADELEGIGGALDALSEEIFSTNGSNEHRGKPRQNGEHLRAVIRKVGRTGNVAGKINDVLLGMTRMIPYVATNAADYMSADAKAKLKSLQRDIASLKDYESHLTATNQFLLDATLGLTNIDQNDIFRILTAVSVVGIPPTFITSLYGMNFRAMPELDWSFGYLFALGLIALTAIVPIVWFKRQGWW